MMKSQKKATSHEKSVIESARAMLYEQALVYYEGKPIGAVAAIPQRPSRLEKGAASTLDLNYIEVFIRDNVPVMIYFLVDGKAEIVRDFLDTCLSLQSEAFETAGVFPTSFTEHQGALVADYGQRAIGRVASVDASLWWPILAYIYVQRTGDRAWACQPQVQIGLRRFLGLILHPWFRDAPTLQVPDGAFMIDRPLDVWGAPLEIQTLLHGALLSSAGLIQIDLEAKGCYGLLDQSCVKRPKLDDFTEQQVVQFRQTISWVKRLRNYLLKHYWVNTKSVQVLRRRPTEQYGDSIVNEHNIQVETIPHWLQDWMGNEGGYLIGNIRTGRPDFRFFTLGNCLGAIFDVLSPFQQQSLFQLIAQNKRDLIGQMPLRICHPPLEDTDWRKKTGYDRKNLPWCYHNGGHWPCLLWFLAIAVLRHQQRHNPLREMAILEVLQSSYELLLHRLPQQGWAEYFDGPTGLWTGQQARLNQTWTITGLLLMHHLLRVNPADARIMDLPDLRALIKLHR
jgi:Alkaline and neutral invertase